MAFYRFVLRGEGVEKDPESTTAFLCPPLECAGFSNQVYVQFVLRSQTLFFVFMPGERNEKNPKPPNRDKQQPTTTQISMA